MKNTLIVIGGILLVALAGFYIYSLQVNKPTEIALFDLVPTDAVIIYENKKPAFLKKQTPDLASWIRKALKQDSVFISPLRLKEVLLSLHITGKQDFGILYYLPDSAILQDITFKKLTKKGIPRKRNFEGHPITELPTLNGWLAYTTVGKNIVISRQSLLIEDVIRSQSEEGSGFRKMNGQLFHLLPADAGQGKVYANINGFVRLTGLFLENEITNDLFKNLGSSVIADARIDGQTLAINGFATDSAAHAISMLSLFNDQHPAAAEIQKIVSNRALFFIHCGIPDIKSWINRRSAYVRNFPESNLAAKPDATSREFYASLGNEYGYCYMSGAKGETDDILILQIKKDRTENLVTLLSSDQQPIENYSNYLIYRVTAPESLAALLWPLNENKEMTFYTRHDSYFLFAESEDVLKGFINDVEEDNTWGKSSEWNKFFNSATLETNLSVEFNGALLIPWALEKLNPRWDSLTVPTEWANLQKGSFQFSRLNDSYYLNGALQFEAGAARSGKTKEDASNPSISFPANVSSFSLVKNHSTGAPELLVETADKILMLLDSDFKVLFKIDIKDQIKGQVFQIDYYKNKKLQYLFVAGHSLHLIDRVGKEVKDYPRTIRTPADPEFLSLLDYDNTRNYRFLITDQKGNFEMTDKDGKLLDGWNSRNSLSKSPEAPRLVRSGNKDFIIVVDGQGIIYAFNRKGESINGFPVTTGIRPEGDWFFEKNSASDYITIVSGDGIKVQTDLKGKIANRENYVRSSPDSKFSLMRAVNGDDYAISRVDKAKIAVLNKKGDLLFEKENPGSEVLETGYYIPAPREKVYCFRDTQQDFTHVLDDKGEEIFARPLESAQLPQMIRRQKDGLMVFTIFNKEITKNSL